MTTLQNRFAELRKEMPDITQADLARATGASPPSVSDWFTGETKSMKIDTAIAAAAVYGVSPLWLSKGKGAKYHNNAAPGPQRDGQQASPSADPPRLPASNVENIANRRTVDSAEQALRVLADILRPMSNSERDVVANNLRSFALDPDSAVALSSLLAGLDAANARRRYEPPPQFTASGGR